MMQYLPSSYLRYGLLTAGALVSISCSAVSSAHAETLPHLSEGCFSYSTGEEKSGTHSLTSKNFHAELPGTGISLSVATTSLNDHNQKLDAAGLSRINAAAAYGVLTAYHHGMTEACANQAIPELDEIKQTLPEAHWTNVTLIRPAHTATIKTAHLKIISSEPTVHTSI